MKVFKTIPEVRAWISKVQASNQTIGLVPTMGFLHEGHISLIKYSKEKCSKTVVTIFVNPTQFSPNEDFEAYPRDFERDKGLCKKAGVDIIFAPEPEQMYLSDNQTFVSNEHISGILCGKSRPIHFKGVTTIVTKLFNIVDPDFAFFGQKDAQQAIIIKNMVRDLNFRTKIFVAPIIREKDGLALSSRNKYLTNKQRKNALVLYNSLQFAKEQFSLPLINVDSIKSKITEMIASKEECEIDYVEFVNAETLSKEIKKGDKVLLALAVFVGSTRLIDNILLQY
ncbi:MAG: pantoate--beta-alanine ligase [Calditrichaeota bacterium]|nr:pantoate--beta-alanine ligase [Calditrichota bacterium]